MGQCKNMRISYIAFLAKANLKNRKLRSVLTIGGMTVGIGAIVFLVSLGFGLQRLITGQITNLEALTVLDVTTGTSALLKIKQETIESFKEIPNVVEVSPSISLSSQASRLGSATDVALFGIDPEFIALEGVNVAWGENFSESAGKETVISNTLVELLGIKNPQNIVGEKISYRIIVPVWDEEGNATEETKTELVNVTVKGVIEDELTVGYVPIELLENYGILNYNLVRIKVTDRAATADVRLAIEQEGLQVDSIADTVGQIDRIFLIFEIIMAGFGLIAMLVASLGAFNTLTVSLLERTREIGIMKALGASRRDVYRIFLAEAFIIGLSGGILGILVGFTLGEIINLAINRLAVQYGGAPVDIFYTPFFLVCLITAVVITISFLTGIYPARRAARLSTLDALRYE